MCLSWGVQPRWVEFASHTDKMTGQVDKLLLEEGVAESGDLVVIAAGSPPGQAGTTNMVKVHRIGDIPDGADVEALRRGDPGALPIKEPVGPWPSRSAASAHSPHRAY